MMFEKYKDRIIDNFVNNLKECALKIELSKDNLKVLHEELDKHKTCFDDYKEEFDKEALDLIDSYVYGNEMVSIECNNCQELLVDSETLLMY